MTATTVQQILTGIETRLATISGLRTRDIAPDSIQVPCAYVTIPPIDYWLTFGSGGNYTLDPVVTVLVSASMDRVGQALLASYADPYGSGSIPQAILADRELGGLVEDCIPTNFDPLGLQEVGAIGYYGGTFKLKVVARRS